MRNDNGCPVLASLCQGTFNDLFALIVQRRRRLVEDEERGLFDESAGDGDSLPLPAAQLSSSITHRRIVAFGQTSSELVNVRHLRRTSAGRKSETAEEREEVEEEWNEREF